MNLDRLADHSSAAQDRPDVKRELLRAAFARLPLNMIMTTVVTFLCTGLWWNLFPLTPLAIWATSVLVVNVMLRYLMWRLYQRQGFTRFSIQVWERYYLVQIAFGGLAWGLGPTLIMHQTVGTESALLVALLFAVCGVAINTLSAQRTAMQWFILTAMLPPAAAAWNSSASMGHVVAFSLAGGAVVLLAIGRNTSQATRNLLATELRLRTILDTALDAVIDINMQGQITGWNLRAESMFGWQGANILGHPLDDIVVQQTSPAAQRQSVQQFLVIDDNTLVNRRVEVVAKRQSGEEFPAEMAIAPIKINDSWHFTAFIADITERKRGAAALRDSEERFRSLIELSPEAVAVHRGGRLLYVNPAAIVLFGAKSANELVDKPVLDRIHPNSRELVLERIRQYATNGGVAPTMEEKFLRLDGTTIDVEVQGRAMTYNGQPAIYATMRDITERKSTQEALQIAATAFESLQGITITDANQVILKVNRAFTQITGFTAQEAIGQTPRLLSSGRHDGAFYAAMWQHIQQTGTWQGEIWNRHKNGDVFPEWLSITAVKNAARLTTHYVATFTDISARKEAEDQIRNLAFYDPLTTLPNRRLLLDRLKQALHSASRRRRRGALLFIDLDNFKTINDTMGHYQGDILLEQVALRLGNCVREGDTVARLGGDEFVIMLEDLSPDAHDAANQAETVGNKVLYALEHPYLLEGRECRCTPSIGVTLFAGQEDSIDDLLKRADLAMYQAKAAGRNTLRFFDPQMQAVVVANAALENGLRLAIENQELQLYFQAQVTGDGEIVGAEALVRWQHPERGMISPAEFIPLAEQTGQILQVGQWVLETACKQLTSWANTPGLADINVSVNVSVKQFRQLDFVSQVLNVLESTAANPQRLKLELTESLLVEDVEDIIAKMTTLKALGVGFSLDDFGTGYSSLAYLSRLPLDQLKIDQGFVRDIETSDNAVAICAATISLAHSLKMKVVAEGVETRAQQYFLGTVHHCDLMQGYLFSHPVPVDEFEQLATRVINHSSSGRAHPGRKITL